MHNFLAIRLNFYLLLNNSIIIINWGSHHRQRKSPSSKEVTVVKGSHRRHRVIMDSGSKLGSATINYLSVEVSWVTWLPGCIDGTASCHGSGSFKLVCWAIFCCCCL